VAGQTTDFHLPEPLVIAEVELGSVFSSHADKSHAAAGIAADLVNTGPIEVVARVESDVAVGRTAWTPTPVPPPSYTMSQAAARWEPKELTEVDYAQAAHAAAQVTEQAAQQAQAAGLTPPETAPSSLPARRIFTDKGIDLDTALNRRRSANS